MREHRFGWRTSRPVNNTPDERSALAQAMAWSSRLTSIALEMVLPGILGFWLDRRWGTGAVFAVSGVAIGFGLGMYQLLQLAGTPPDDKKSSKSSPRDGDAS